MVMPTARLTISDGAPALTVRTPLVSPTTSASPSPPATAGQAGQPAAFISQAAQTAHAPMTGPVDKSISPAIISITSPSPTSAGYEAAVRIDLTVAGASMAGFSR